MLTPSRHVLGQERLAGYPALAGAPSADHWLHPVDGLLLTMSVPVPPA